MTPHGTADRAATAAGILSAPVGVVAPPRLGGLPGWAYAMPGPAMPLYGPWVQRRRPAAVLGAPRPTGAAPSGA